MNERRVVLLLATLWQPDKIKTAEIKRLTAVLGTPDENRTHIYGLGNHRSIR